LAIVTLESKSATLVPGAGKSSSRRGDGSSLIMKVELSRRASIWLEADKKAFSGDMSLAIREASTEDINGVVDITKGVEGLTDDTDVAGGMSYSASRRTDGAGSGQRPAILFEVFVPAKDMASMVKLSKSGRYPRKAWVDVRGLGYRTARRDAGAQLLWRRHEDQWMLPIVHVSFEMPLHPQHEFTLGYAEPEHAAAQADHRRSAQRIERLLEPIFVRISARLWWAVWILVAVALGVAFWVLR
jgi:hypothetical protein